MPGQYVEIIRIQIAFSDTTLLQIRETSALSDEFVCGYKGKDVLVLPDSFTGGARAMAAFGNKTSEFASVRFTGSPGQVVRNRCTRRTIENRSK